MEDQDQGQGQVAQEPDKISVIVHGGKNFQANKKGRCKFSVIFGVGSKKFRTDVVEDVFGSPVWHTEGEIDVDNAAHPLILTATEKDDPIGQVIIPLNELPHVKPYMGKKVALGPHKKCPDPSGEVIVSAWISATRAPKEAKSSPSGALKSLKKMKSKISHSPLLRRKSKHGDGQPAGMKGSMSMGDLAGQGRRKTNLLSVPSDSLCSVNSTDSDTSNQLSGGDIRESLKRPEVSGISPKEGPVEGGTRITIRGINLGRSPEDVIAVYVCGCNCVGTLEYESTSKIYCTTGKWKSGAGDIVVETTSGGKGTSMVQFSFAQKEASPGVTKRMSPLLGRRKSPSPSMTHKKRSSDTSMLSLGNVSIPEEEEKPEVSGISPKEGPIEGGTRLTIRGQNLGSSREDIVAATVCGKDCLATLEYESPRKIYLTTRAWKPCSGDIVIETKSGGKGSSTVQYTFVMPVASPPAPSPATTRRTLQDTLDVNMDAEAMHKYSIPSPAFSEDEDDEDDTSIMKPEVTGISPREGPAEGGTRLTIRGINLGKCREDIVGLSICDANCLPMIEYESPMKLYCTTPPWKLGPGHIIVETRQGGKGSSLVQFTYKKMSVTTSPSAATQGVTDPPAKPPRKTSVSSTSSSAALGAMLMKQPSEQSVTPDISVEPPVPASQDETDDFGGATPYPDEPRAVLSDTRRVDPAPTGSVTTGSAMTGTARVTRISPKPTEETSHHTPIGHQTSARTPDGQVTRPQPLGQEIKVGKENKRQAPLPPSSNKPPMYPSGGQKAGGTTASRQLPVTPGSGDIRDSNESGDGSDKTNEQDLMNKGANILEMIAAQDKKEKFLKEQQQERVTQSGPTRQELMEEIRRVKLDNRDLREQNHMMKQYLERLLSHVMTRCPDILCTDIGN